MLLAAHWRTSGSVMKLLPLCLASLALACTVGLSQAGAAEAESDYAFWAADPSQPGPDLPLAGRSLFDHLVTEREGGAYRVPFPFATLIERVQARLTQEELFGGTRIALFPMGRSLQRAAAAPDFFKFPRIVFAVTGEPAANERDAGVLLKDRLYIGYVEKTGVLEVISYNEAAGRFEFQLVKDYRAGGVPKVYYASRAICVACHQNHAPIFSKAIWGESNANGRVAELLRAHQADLGLSSQANIDFPDDIDKATVRASALVPLQTVWQQGCSQPQDRAQAQRCRAAAFAAVLQYGLSGEQDFDAGAPAFQREFVATLGRVWRQRWPQGLRIAESSLPDRNPLGGGNASYGGGTDGEASADWIAAAHVPAGLDPLNPRPPREIWRFTGGLDAPRLVAGWTKFFAAADFRALDAHLLRSAGSQPVERAVHSARCVARRTAGAGEWRLECTGTEPSAHGLNLAGRFDEGGSARIEWLSLGPAGRMREVASRGEVLRVGAERHLRATPKQRQGLTPRFPDGRALASLEIRWPAAQGSDGRPLEVRVEVVVLDDFALVRQALARLSTRQAVLFDDAPLARAKLMGALFAELGMTERAWCCADAAGMPPAALEPIEVDASAVAQPELQPFFRACAMCHLSPERFPPNFLAGSTSRVGKNLRQCAPRMLVRLAAWGTPEQQRVKSPMPPLTALPALGTSAHRWAASEELAQIRSHVEGLAQRQGLPSDPAALLEGGYEALPACLPPADR
jgi:hypothetical protein